MAKPPLPRRRHAGFTLIEALVVLAIIAALSIAFVYSLGPKSPRAVRAALIEMRGALNTARNLAAQTGQPVSMIWNHSTDQIDFMQIDPATGSPVAGVPPLASTSLSKTWRRWALVTPSLPADMPTPATNSAVLSLFRNPQGWATPMDDSSGAVFGFASSGQPQMFKAAGGAITPLPDGFWIGVQGLSANQKGFPYGVVIVNGQGMVLAYFKPDSLLDAPAEYLWKRLD